MSEEELTRRQALTRRQLQAFRDVVWPIVRTSGATVKGTCVNLSVKEADIVFKGVSYLITLETLGILGISKSGEELKLLQIEEINLTDLKISPYQRGKLRKKIQFLSDMVMGYRPICDELQVPLRESGFRVVGYGSRPMISWSPQIEEDRVIRRPSDPFDKVGGTDPRKFES